MTRRPLIMQLIHCPKDDKVHRTAEDGEIFKITLLNDPKIVAVIGCETDCKNVFYNFLHRTFQKCSKKYDVHQSRASKAIHFP